MCGIFGWVGRDPRSFNMDKFTILGILNEDRGRHSCGLSIDGEIKLGVDTTKVFRDFKADVDIVDPTSHGVVIGHTRHATKGAHTARNAHPFGFGENKGSYEMIGAHNGSLLTDYKDIATKRGISTEVKVHGHNNTFYTVDKIDSEILLEALYMDGDYSVLSEYNGAAALVWYHTDDPNTLYLFHGASPEDKYDEKIWIERPLHIWQETRYSMYFSSTAQPLQLIGAKKNHIVSLPHNKVFKIKNGDFKNAEIVNISRKGRVHESLYSSYNYTKKNKDSVGANTEVEKFNTKNDCKVEYTAKNNTHTETATFGKKGDTSICKDVLKAAKKMAKRHPDIINIYSQVVEDVNSYHGRIYEHMLRYWRNSSPIEGIYTWVPNYGFYHIGVTEAEAKTSINRIINKVWDDGHFREKNNKDEKPLFTNINPPSVHYFINGIKVQHILDYNVLKNQDMAVKSLYKYDNVSMCSTHPIADLTTWKAASKQEIRFDNMLYTGIFCPMGSENIYHIVDGNLVKIEKVKSGKVSVIELPNSLDEAIDAIADEVDFELSGQISDIDKQIEEDQLEKTLDSIFMEPYSTFPDQAKLLRNEFPNNEKAKEGATILEDFVRRVTPLIAVDVN